MMIEKFALVKCNGKGDTKCDWCCLYHLEGLDLTKFKCPICKGNSCSVKTFEKVPHIEIFNLMCSINRFLYRLNRKMNPIFIKKREDWIKQHKKELKDRTNKEIERIALNNLFSGKINIDEYKEQIQFLKVTK